MNTQITIIDSTLRDGSHAMHHQFNEETVHAYARGAEAAGMKLLVVGHGNGLGASSLHLGESRLSDVQMLTIAKKELKHTKLAGFLIPGFGTIKNDIAPAIDAGIEALIVACHCTEANVTRQHIGYGISHDLATYGVLMMSHMIGANELLEQAKLMEGYGAQGIILMDSAGAYVPSEVTEKVSALVGGLSVAVGFHSHNNLGLAIGNALRAVEAGATIIDGTSRGLGAGAGNCPLEVIVAVLQKTGRQTGLDLYQLMDNAELIREKTNNTTPEINSVTLTSGLSGVFSGFAPLAKRAAERFGVDVRDILVELGGRKVVAGQEDIIVEVALYLKQKKEGKPEDFQLESLT
ncbi:MAG TPA: 4-hydroxy-2-oxovalerate aldolase [Patescibacteria group bacterium]|nr:4-hydroxy-2-oxovalerate aldolase [Patescibacteria group bacterium]